MEIDDETRSTRRDVLKKLAVVGVAAGTTSVIVTSRAFADGGTVRSRPTGTGTGSMVLTGALFTKDDFTVGTISTLVNGACLVPTPANPRIEYAWSLESVNVGSTILTITGTAFSTSLLNGFVGSDTGNITGTYVVRLTVRWVCDQAPNGATAAWVCRSFIATVTQSPSGGNIGNATIGLTTESSPGPICNATTPAPPLP